ncbi:hypothetical protein Tco_1085775, partial [Tanacetum coccineum]
MWHPRGIHINKWDPLAGVSADVAATCHHVAADVDILEMGLARVELESSRAKAQGSLLFHLIQS